MRLHIAGGGAPDYEERLQQIVSTLELEDQVTFLGTVPPHSIAKIYNKADVFVLASYYEAFGIVLIEAMAAGLPVVATDVGGIPNVVEKDISAFLVPAGDASALAEAMRVLAIDKEKAREMSAQARRRASGYGLAAGVDALFSCYKVLVAEKG